MIPLYLLFSLHSLASGEAPAGTPLHIRLTTSLSSYASRVGTPLSAVLIAPVTVNGATVLPAGSTLSGRVNWARRVGLGIVHETAAMELEFNHVTLPNGETLPLSAQVAEVDNGRERVNQKGRISGVRTTSSLSNRLCGYLKTMLLWHIEAQVATWAIKSVVMHVPEPEIYYPAGVELTLSLSQPMRVSGPVEYAQTSRGLSGYERADLARLVASMPYRTHTGVARRPSDIINTIFIGSSNQLAAAFAAAGWAEAHPPSFRSCLRGIHALVDSEGYRYAPISTQLVNDAEADVSWQKSLNDMKKRHHIRVWKQAGDWQGKEIWIGAATRDIDYAYLRPGQAFTHKIEADIDQERDKIVDDLAFTSCAEVVDWLDRPDVPHTTRNATGDLMNTDGRLAVVSFNKCSEPRLSTETVDDAPVRIHGNGLQQFARREIMSFRSDLIRDNLYYRTYEGARLTITALRKKRRRHSDAESDSERPRAIPTFGLRRAQDKGEPPLS